MSTFRRITNLAKGVLKTEVRKWGEGDGPEPDLTPDRLKPVPRPKAAPAAPPAPATPTAPAAPERDENGEIKRTL